MALTLETTGIVNMKDLARQEVVSYLAKKDSVLLPKLLPNELEFLQVVAEDDVTAVRAYCLSHPSLDINCVDFQGTSALHIAVKNRSEAMVEFLLTQPNIEIGDTIMHAVRENAIKILEKLLDTRKNTSPALEFVGSTHSPDFPEYVTPLMLAAHSRNYEIVALLVNRGHTIPQPHSPNCLCGECKSVNSTIDVLRASNARLASYQAMCAPEYLIHVTADPILAAFRLARMLKAHADTCRHQAAAYMQLRKQVSEFAVNLIGCCWTSAEVEAVLKQTCCLSRSLFKLPRLLMAVDYKQKEFVAHPNTQLVLQSYWLENWSSWETKSTVRKGLIITSRIFIAPLILFMCVAAPCHRLVSHYQIPLNKLITHATAYFVFLALVFYISNQDKAKQKRGPPNTGAETPLMLFVLGHAWSALRKCVVQGPRRYFSYAWNIFDLTMLLLFGLTFAFWLAAKYETLNEHEELERKYWNQHDPTLLAEGTFCLATIFAFFRLLSFCQLNYHLGPLQVSLGKMTVDIYQYLKVYAIIISAFAVGLAHFYQYYDGMVYEDEAGMKTVQASSFISLPDTLKTLFWALFCLSPLESADVVLDNRNSSDGLPLAQHTYTERIGYFCFGCFEVISVIVVLNMLIATMSNTYQRVINNVATEWTFGKTEMYLNYMYETTLPSPYNLVPTPIGVKAAAEWLFRLCRHKLPAKCCTSYANIVNIQL
ncbi:short transient receptor potential channel 4-like [Leguminivora glycinivorella]|uniref:short transient receptor potential channel 4-like n=1 Tax=Leguminivora glycinivorella TaxID=1035111 RepID=UPI00200D079B|nr:short transient receptor potential channel 4-like [Leguminivora glycinivorella]